MRFLANENFPVPSIDLLRKRGHDVEWITEKYPGIGDGEVIKKAKDEDRIILTFDKDYGEIIFKFGKANPPAVVFFRYKGQDNPEEAGKHLLELIENTNISLTGHFTVINRESYRQRRYSNRTSSE